MEATKNPLVIDSRAKLCQIKKKKNKTSRNLMQVMESLAKRNQPSTKAIEVANQVTRTKDQELRLKKSGKIVDQALT